MDVDIGFSVGQAFICNLLEDKQGEMEVKQGPSGSRISLQMRPSLYNSYQRQYFVNSQDIRLTIDDELHYQSPDKPIQSSLCKGDFFVVEVKYPPENSEQANKLIKKIPLPLDKNSKYQTGISQEFPWMAS